MVSQLAGPLKKTIAKAFKGKLLVGTIRRVTAATVDNYGDPVPGTVTLYTFEGIRESFDARYLMQAGIPDTDVKVLVLLGTVKPTETQPKQDDYVYIGFPARWHHVRRVLTIDPAGASMLLQCTEVDGVPGP